MTSPMTSTDMTQPIQSILSTPSTPSNPLDSVVDHLRELLTKLHIVISKKTTNDVLDAAEGLLSKINDVLNANSPNMADDIARLSSAYYMCIPYDYDTIPPLIDSHEKMYGCYNDVSVIRQYNTTMNEMGVTSKK